MPRVPPGQRHRTEGRARLPPGISSRAAIAAPREIGRRWRMAGETIVVILPSFAECYLSTTSFDGL